VATAALGLTAAAGTAAVAHAAAGVPAGYAVGDQKAIQAAIDRAFGSEWTRVSSAQVRTLVAVLGADVTRIPLPGLRAAIWVAARPTVAVEPRNGMLPNGWRQLSSAQYRTLVEVLGTDAARIPLTRLRAIVAHATASGASVGSEAKNEPPFKRAPGP
jgi:hypothetical protein